MALVWAVAPGCYNSQWGEQKAAQKRNAVTAAPAALRANEREGEGPPSPPTERYWVHKLGIAFTYAVPIT